MKPDIVDYIYDCDLKFRNQAEILKGEAIEIAKGLKDTYIELTKSNKTSYDMKTEFDSVYGNKNVTRMYKFFFRIHTDKDEPSYVVINTIIKVGFKTIMKFDIRWGVKRFSAKIHTEMKYYDEITEEIAKRYIKEEYDYVLIFNSPKISRKITKLLTSNDVIVYTGVSEEKLQKLLSKLSKQIKEG